MGQPHATCHCVTRHNPGAITTNMARRRGQLDERLNTHVNFVYYYSCHLMEEPRDHGQMPDGVT